MRIDILLWKSLEFTNEVGQKVKVTEIPVLEDDSTYHFMVAGKLQIFLTKIMRETTPKAYYSFREYLKSVLKWPIYCQIVQKDEMKSNV